MSSRQKNVGWVLIVFAGVFLAYFLKVRLLSAGPAVDKKEWLQAIGLVVILMIGTINVRLAAARARNQSADPARDRTGKEVHG